MYIKIVYQHPSLMEAQRSSIKFD